VITVVYKKHIHKRSHFLFRRFLLKFLVKGINFQGLFFLSKICEKKFFSYDERGEEMLGNGLILSPLKKDEKQIVF